jgi:transketolase C-terminal domain/subunit
MAERVCRARLIRLGTPDVFGESGTADEMLEKHSLTPLAIARRLRHEFGR